MKLNNTWPPPPGFKTVLNYSREPTMGEVVVGAARISVDGEELVFWVGEERESTPTLPLKGFGTVRHEGVDVPTRWAVDADGDCYYDNQGAPEADRKSVV